MRHPLTYASPWLLPSTTPYHTMTYDDDIKPYHTIPCQQKCWANIIAPNMTKLNQTIPYHTILYHIKPYYNIPYQTNHTIPTYNTTTYNTTRNKTMMTMVSRNNNGFMRLCVGRVTKKYPKRNQPNNIIYAYLHQKSEDHRYYLHICIASYVMPT